MSKLFLKHHKENGYQLAEALLLEDLPPGVGAGVAQITRQYEETFTNAASVTISHAFITRHCTLLLYREGNGHTYQMPETAYSAPEYFDDHVQVDFISNETGKIVVIGIEEITWHPPTDEDFVNANSITINHTYPDRNINIELFRESGTQTYKMPSTAYSAEITDTAVIITFNSAESGHVRLTR